MIFTTKQIGDRLFNLEEESDIESKKLDGFLENPVSEPSGNANRSDINNYSKYFRKINALRNKIKIIKGKIDNLNLKREELSEMNPEEKPYFLWHLYFMDVFNTGGFDIVIGNPPYIQLQKMGKYTDALQNLEYETFKRTGDIYTIFYEKGIDILKKGGILTIISSNTWMRTKFGGDLRQFFISNSNPQKLLNFEDTKIFPSATVEINICQPSTN